MQIKSFTQLVDISFRKFYDRFFCIVHLKRVPVDVFLDRTNAYLVLGTVVPKSRYA